MRLQEQHQAMLLEQSLLAVLKPLVGGALLIEKVGPSAVRLGGEANWLEAGTAVGLLGGSWGDRRGGGGGVRASSSKCSPMNPFASGASVRS